MGTWIAVGKIEWLHRKLEHDFMAGAARLVDVALRVRRKRHEGEIDFRRKLRQRQSRIAGPDAEPPNDNGNAGAFIVGFEGARICGEWRSAVARHARQRACG